MNKANNRHSNVIPHIIKLLLILVTIFLTSCSASEDRHAFKLRMENTYPGMIVEVGQSAGGGNCVIYYKDKFYLVEDYHSGVYAWIKPIFNTPSSRINEDRTVETYFTDIMNKSPVPPAPPSPTTIKAELTPASAPPAAKTEAKAEAEK